MTHKIIHPKMFYYGFPVVLLTTCGISGKNNISPISSSWVLSDNIIIGLGTQGKAFENINECPEVVVNIPDQTLWQQVEAIAPFTGKFPIPDFQQGTYSFCEDKFKIGNFTIQQAEKVRPSRIKECPLQAETKVENINIRNGFAIIELKIQVVHALPHLVYDDKILPEQWKPLIYNFRCYQGLGEILGRNFREETKKLPQN
ncbi:MAG: flavin reductase family protein [Capnocytophaga sp.]|nr:flavin reductase family protein [Capnocytophaga sp.]